MDEEDAQLVRTWGELPDFKFEPRDSTEIASARGWIDMARGARLSGSRFAYRIGDVALAEMALYRYVIDKLTSRASCWCCRPFWSASAPCTAPDSCPPKGRISITSSTTTCT